MFIDVKVIMRQNISNDFEVCKVKETLSQIRIYQV